MATLSFSVIGAGTGLLTLTVNELGDANGDPFLDPAVQRALITAQIRQLPPGGVPEPSMPLLIAAGFLGWGLVHRKTA